MNYSPTMAMTRQAFTTNLPELQEEINKQIPGPIEYQSTSPRLCISHRLPVNGPNEN